jgi:fermentation-respiration switch protein FrsA (DUF1100 family)
MSVIALFFMVIFAYSALVAFLYFFQRHLIYLPAQFLRPPSHYGLSAVEEVTIKTKDGLKLVAWYRAPKENQPILLYFHGNTGHLGNRAEKLATFLDSPIGLLAISYRGYGGSEGSPSEEGLYADASAAVQFAVSRGFSLEQIVLYGESLGTGVAVHAATEFPSVRALVLEAPYLSVKKRAQEKYPYMPVDYILKDHFDSESKIRNVKAPILIFHGHRDEVIPFMHGQVLFALANEPKEGHWYPDVHHTDFSALELIQQLQRFLHRHTLMPNSVR